MDYEQQCLAMMKDLGENFTNERFVALVKALGSAIAKTATVIEDHDRMHAAIQAVCDSIHAQACAEHKLVHPNQHTQQMNAEQFLRDVFKPERTND